LRAESRTRESAIEQFNADVQSRLASTEAGVNRDLALSLMGQEGQLGGLNAQAALQSGLAGTEFASRLGGMGLESVNLLSSIDSLNRSIEGQNLARELGVATTQSGLSAAATEDRDRRLAYLQSVLDGQAGREFQQAATSFSGTPGYYGLLQDSLNDILFSWLSAAQAILPSRRGGGESSSGSVDVGSAIGGVGAAAGGLALLSHPDLKDREGEVRDDDVLDSVLRTPVERWRYKGEKTEHIGPMSDVFHREFQVGDDRTIHQADALGVALSSIRSLARKVERLEDKLHASS
jgi:hypothetical protein